MKKAIQKEIQEGLRTYKFLIIISVFMFFAIMNPVLNKMILPEALKSQLNGISDEVLNQILISSQRDCVRGYLQDTFEIFTLVFILSLSSIVSGELRNRTFIFPRYSKKDFSTLILSKLVVYGSYVFIAATICACINYAYSGLLFGADLPSIIPVIRGGLLQGLYYIYVLCLIMLVGSFISKPIYAGLVTLIPAYGTYMLSQLYNIDKYTPSGLLKEATLLAYNTSTNIAQPIIITFALILLLTLLTILRLENVELTRR